MATAKGPASANNRYRLLVSFDIPGAKGGDRRYGAVDEFLASQGRVLHAFKQMRLLITSSEPTELAPALSAIVGPSASVLVVHAAKPFRFVLGTSNPRANMRKQVTAWMKGAK